jgi:hypothetical protein
MVTYIGHVLDYRRKESDPIINRKICIDIHNYRGYTSGYIRICISTVITQDFGWNEICTASVTDTAALDYGPTVPNAM